MPRSGVRRSPRATLAGCKVPGARSRLSCGQVAKRPQCDGASCVRAGGGNGRRARTPPACQSPPKTTRARTALRQLDHSGADLILVEDVPSTAAWSAIADRLQRAASGAGD